MMFKLTEFILTLSALILISPVSVFAKSASLSLIKSSTSNQVEIVLKHDYKDLVGVDVVLKFDPQTFHIISANKSDLFSEFVSKQIDHRAGIIKLAFSNPYLKYTSTSGTLATLEIDSKLNSTSQLDFVFTHKSTVDTNVVDSKARDVLDSVTNLTIIPDSIPQTQAQVLGDSVDSIIAPVASSYVNAHDLVINHPTSPLIPLLAIVGSLVILFNIFLVWQKSKVFS